MKKVHTNSLSKSLTSASIWALGFFAVFGVALYTYAITYPDTQPNPVSGVVGMFVGSSPVTYDGDAVGSYSKVNAICEEAYEYSHICSPMEMVNTYNHNPTILQGETESFWLNSGEPGNITNVNNDCRGWTVQTRDVFGTVWSTNKSQSLLAHCGLERKYACCK